jgi:hypothetical protein
MRATWSPERPLVRPRLEPVGAEQPHLLGDRLPDAEVGGGAQAVGRGVHGVLRHHAVGRQLAAGDHDQPRDGRHHGVLATDLARRLGLPRQQRSEAGVDPLDVLVVERLAQDRVDVGEDVVDVGP